MLSLDNRRPYKGSVFALYHVLYWAFKKNKGNIRHLRFSWYVDVNILVIQIHFKGSYMQKIQDLIEEIKNLEKRLTLEIQKKEEEFSYEIHGKKVTFEEEVKRYHKTLATKIYTYIFNAAWLNILTVPVIWFAIVPAVFLDIFVTIYQFICFPVYKIPKVQRNDYIVIDRYELKYLNAIEKLNCVYCGYFNGLFSYVQEIAARTEQHWCPIKHARRIGSIHSRYRKFLEYGDGDGYRNRVEEIRRDFEDLKQSQ